MATKEDCIEALRAAEDRLGHSPTLREYEDLGLSPARSTIYRVFDSWNDAKEAAGVEAYDYGYKSPNDVLPVPADLDFTQEEWENDLSARQRWYYKNRDAEIERINKRADGLEQFVRDYKKERSCSQCDEDFYACLEFHHTDPSEKEYNVSRMPDNGVAKETIREEIEKCILLCKNCHTKFHLAD